MTYLVGIMDAQRVGTKIADVTTRSMVAELSESFGRYELGSEDDLALSVELYSEGKDRVAYIQRNCVWAEFMASIKGIQSLEGLHMVLMSYWRLVGLRRVELTGETRRAANEAWESFKFGALMIDQQTRAYVRAHGPELPKLAEDRIEVSLA